MKQHRGGSPNQTPRLIWRRGALHKEVTLDLGLRNETFSFIRREKRAFQAKGIKSAGFSLDRAGKRELLTVTFEMISFHWHHEF